MTIKKALFLTLAFLTALFLASIDPSFFNSQINSPSGENFRFILEIISNLIPIFFIK